MGISRRDLSDPGGSRRKSERRSQGASRSTASGAFSLGRLNFGSCVVVGGSQIFVVFASKRPQNPGMTTAIRRNRLCGWSIRCAVVAVLCALSASAFAETGKNVVSPVSQQPVQKRFKRVCYVITSTSAIPMPCNRLAAIPTTASPMSIYGHRPEKQ